MEESWESLARGKDTYSAISRQSGWFLEDKLPKILPLWMLVDLKNCLLLNSPQKTFSTNAMTKTENPNKFFY